ncbi:MAG TPA: glycoside hydrolase family 11 protein [Polyangia bacterium]|nr:glycoside hydrolase family 11 protein [Polyangia bacterium]
MFTPCRSPRSLVLLSSSLAALALAACATPGTDGGDDGTGGSSVTETGGSHGGGQTGGNSATGGSTGSGTGGETATGGHLGTGGAIATGGHVGTGGVPGTGGALGTGGVVGTGGHATGGAFGTGGVLGTGGAVSTGGVVGTGGHATGGAPGTGGTKATGGTTGTGGSTGSTGGSTGGTCSPGTTLSGGSQHCSSNASGSVGSYQWTIWSSGSGGCLTTYNANAEFGATWNNSGDFLARVGLSLNQSYTSYPNLAADFAETKSGSAGGYSYVGIYGWSENPIHEYYIVEDWFGSTSAPNPGGTLMESNFTISGEGTYNIYQHQQVNQPAITGGNQTFYQFFSVRTSPRQCGHISIAKHFAEWNRLGMTLGNMEEAKLLVEAGGGSGSITFSTATMTTN